MAQKKIKIDEATIYYGEKPDLSHPILIEGLPGVGTVGKLAAEHLIDEIVMKEYGQSGVVLSSRLHGIIIASALGKRIIAISEDEKIEGYMDELGLSDWVCSNTQELTCLINRVEHQEDYREKIERILERNHEFSHEVKMLVSH